MYTSFPSKGGPLENQKKKLLIPSRERILSLWDYIWFATTTIPGSLHYVSWSTCVIVSNVNSNNSFKAGTKADGSWHFSSSIYIYQPLTSSNQVFWLFRRWRNDMFWKTSLCIRVRRYFSRTRTINKCGHDKPGVCVGNIGLNVRAVPILYFLAVSQNSSSD